MCAYQSGKFKQKGNKASIDVEILAVIYGLNSFRIFFNKPEILIRTDSEAILKFHQKINDKTSSRRRWLNFLDTISIYHSIIFEHIKGNDNSIADQLSRLLIKV